MSFEDDIQAELAEAEMLLEMEINQAIHNSISAIIEKVVAAALVEIGKIAGSIDVKAFEQYVNENMERVYQNVGEAGWRSMMSSYGQVVTSRAGPSYRQGRGRYPGALKQALGDKSAFFQADRYGLHFGNIDHLNQAAKHWQRITFGAGQSGSGINHSVDLSYHGISLGSIGIDRGARPGFSLPPGFWKGNAGGEGGKRSGAEFYPFTHRLAQLEKSGRPLRWIPTKGIATHDYLSAAVDRIARQLPIELDKLFQEAMKVLTNDVPTHESKEVKN